jgi:uncharacterized protein
MLSTEKYLDSQISIFQQAVLDKTVEYVQRALGYDKVSHDWWHIYRVWKTAIYIARQEQADLFIVQLAALLHDIADWKFHQGDDTASANVAEKWLREIAVEEEVASRVIEIINGVTFKGAKVENTIKTLEGKIVQDADRLDAIGAIGIARTFAYGGHKGIAIHDPNILPVLHTSFAEYKNHKGTTINHFYEKLLLLKDLMNTKTGKKLAEKRHKIMENYLDQFNQEWNT